MNKQKQEKKERNRLDKEWRNTILYIHNWRCAICGADKLINAHHIIPREFKETRHDPANGIALCPRHHKWGLFSAHKNPLWLINWMEKNKMDVNIIILKKMTEELYETTSYKK